MTSGRVTITRPSSDARGPGGAAGRATGPKAGRMALNALPSIEVVHEYRVERLDELKHDGALAFGQFVGIR